jgi:hypothetical protein
MSRLLQDLDVLTWVATIATLVICSIVAGMAMFGRGTISGGIEGIQKFLTVCGVALVFCAFNVIGRVSDAPHRLISGSVQITRRLPGLRHTYHRLLLCVSPCATSPRLYMHDEASDAFERGTRVPSLTLGYLVKSEEAERGLWVYEVVDIINTETGRSYYHRDTDHHPIRVAFLFGDALLALLTAALCAGLADSAPAAETNAEIDPGGLRAMPSELTSIHLTDAESRAESEKWDGSMSQ